MTWVESLAGIARTRRKGASAWGLAAALFAVSLAASLALSPWFPQSAFLTFFPAVAATVLLCGLRRGVVVLVLSGFAAWYFLLRPSVPQVLTGWSTAFQIGGFLTVGGALLTLLEALLVAVQQLDKAAALQKSLFQELQHRVANNLQIVAGTLQKAQRSVKDAAALEIIEHARARIDSLGKLNRRLYEAAAYQQGLEPVLRDVLAETFHALPVTIRLDVSPRELSPGEMTAITLLVNEAAINAAKHVFRPERGSLFEVSLIEVEPGRMQLTVRDDGPGIGPVSTARPAMQRFGITIMQSLANQLGSSLELMDGPGATLSVMFSRGELGSPG